MRLPEDIRDLLTRQEWRHRYHFRSRIMGERTSVDLPLKPPTGKEVLNDLAGFRAFVDAWKVEESRFPNLVTFEIRGLQTIGSQSVPTRVHFQSTLDIARFMGDSALERLRRLRDRLIPFEAVSVGMRRAAERYVHTLESLPVEVCRQVAAAIAQMRRGMGAGLFLRALPLDGIDTKLVERHRVLVENLLDDCLVGEVKDAGGLISWLGCLTKGQDRVMIRPLSPEARDRLWGLDRCWVTTDTLATARIDAKRLLIVENEISGLILPDIPDTVAVIGCGANLAWLRSPWVRALRVGYWGDLDSWGLRLLSKVREAVPDVQPLMMDRATWDHHPAAVVTEHEPCTIPTSSLTASEIELFQLIRGLANGSGRLEQEKLKSDWITQQIMAWAELGGPLLLTEH